MNQICFLEMPKVIFVSYANDAMAYSLKRIGRQARKLGVFDEVILYTPNSLPKYVKESPLFPNSRGAGYWCWKPAIIYETLSNYDEGTIVVYVDAGCTLRQSQEWNILIDKLAFFDSICFQYEEYQPQWKKLGSSSSKLKYWTKKDTLEFLKQYTHNSDVGEICSLLGGCVFMKNKNNSLLQKWNDIIIHNPEVIEDPRPIELSNQNSCFVCHRHDQSVLTALAVHDTKTLILPENIEQYQRDSFIWASRIRAHNWKEYIIIQTKHYLRIWLGDSLFERIKKIVLLK